METKTEINKRVGHNIARLRLSRNLTQVELAAEIGTCSTTLSEYENGHKMPMFSNLVALANYFQVPAEVLFRNDSFCATEGLVEELAQLADAREALLKIKNNDTAEIEQRIFAKLKELSKLYRALNG